MKKLKRIFDLPVLVTIVLLLILLFNTLTSFKVFQSHTENRGLDTVWDSVDSMIYEIQNTVADNERQLRTIANIVGLHDDLEDVEIKDILSSFEGEGAVEDLYLLLPDNRLLNKDGTYITKNVPLDFEQEKTKDAYISHRLDSFADIHEKVIYHAVPVLSDGQVKGVLYGVIRLTHLAEIYQIHCFDGNAAVYLTEGDTGNFLLDTWHGTFTSTDELGVREMKPGYDHAQSIKDLRAGKTGVMVLVSKTLHEYVYVCYKAVGVNDWSIALHVAQSTIFREMNQVRKVQFLSLIIKFMAVVLYIIWLLFYKGKKAVEQELQLNQVSYMFDIQQTLFDVHRNEAHMQTALCKIGKKLQAESAFFLTNEGDGRKNVYSWSAADEPVPDKPWISPVLQSKLKADGSYLLYDIESIKKEIPETYEKLKQAGVRSIMLTLIRDKISQIVGVLGVCNMSYKWEDVRYLECVSMDFFQAYKNIENSKMLSELATIDLLTGLQNRNSYEKVLEIYKAGETSLPDACVYLDVNGLHEINNQFGHAAGDAMLCCVGSALRLGFGMEHTYRIGGDEFLVFLFGESEEEIQAKLKELNDQVESKDYHISIGLECALTKTEITAMVAGAEKKMYEAKAKYYHENPDAGRRREDHIQK